MAWRGEGGAADIAGNSARLLIDHTVQEGSDSHEHFETILLSDTILTLKNSKITCFKNKWAF